MMDRQIGRESKKDNDLFFTCSLIDYIARKTKNTRKDIVNSLGKQRVEKIYDLADVYHSDNIDRVSQDFIEEAGIQQGNFDNVGDCGYAIPTYWDIGKVYKRLIKMVAEDEHVSIVDALFEVYNSFISSKIDDYNAAILSMTKDKQVYYVNVAEAFKDDTGALPDDASPKDGMHFGAEYYQKWFDYLKTHTVQ